MAEGTAAATREKTVQFAVQFGISACAPGIGKAVLCRSPGLAGTAKLSSFLARFASRPSAAQAPSPVPVRVVQ